MSEAAALSGNEFTAHPHPWTETIAAVAFDCFGTLANFVDDHFIEAFERIGGSVSLGVAGKHLWDQWLEEGKRLWEERGRDSSDPLAGPEPEFFTYRHAWSIQFERSFAAFGGVGSGADASTSLLDQISAAACFPEVPFVLETLRRSYRIAVLSNADDDFLSAFLERSGLQFEAVVSSEGVQSYKPRAPIFKALCAMLQLEPHEVLYVGDSPIADLLGARAAGLPVVWVNRTGAKLPNSVPAPNLEISGLTGLLEVLPLLSLPAPDGPSS
jgi:2-haloalkanoic acid dehalogenase type II